MKKISFLTLVLYLFLQTNSDAQDIKIPFDNGILKICSSKNFKIKGYDGKEVVIKSRHSGIRRGQFGVPKSQFYTQFTTNRIKTTDSVTVLGRLWINDEKDRGEGLQKLGKKAMAYENGIYLKIEQKANELILKDDNNELFFSVSDESYELLIPNTLKLQWNTSSCETNKSYTSLVYYSKSSDLSEFKGEVEISTSLKNLNLVDVSGPVSINTIGGNVTVEFNKTKPQYLYSIYSNNGFIDIKLPISSSLSIDATADEIFTDLDFTIESESEDNGSQQMKLKLGKGKVKMNLNAGFGNIYLRKQ